MNTTHCLPVCDRIINGELKGSIWLRKIEKGTVSFISRQIPTLCVGRSDSHHPKALLFETNTKKLPSLRNRTFKHVVIYFQNVSEREWDIIHTGFSHGHQQEEQVWEWLSKFYKNIWCTSCGWIKPQTCLTSPAFLIPRLHNHWFSHNAKKSAAAGGEETPCLCVFVKERRWWRTDMYRLIVLYTFFLHTFFPHLIIFMPEVIMRP